MKNSKIDGDKVFMAIIYTAITILFVVVLYPLIYIVSASFSDPIEVTSGHVWLWPVKPTLLGYKAVFQNSSVWLGYANSIIYMVSGTIVNVLLSIMAAYPLSRKDLHGRNLFMAVFVFTMFFSGGLIPLYLVVKQVGILNTRLAMILPGGVAVWNVILARTYFQSTIPSELLDSSKIDGCDDFKFIIKIILPLSKPIIAVLILYSAIGHWNSYFNAFIFLNKQELYPLQIILRNILIKNQNTSGMMMNIEQRLMRERISQILKYSLIVVASVPVLIIYPMVQQYFIKGVMIGSIKG